MKAGRTLEAQEILFPVVMELPIEEHAAVMEFMDIFKEIGFDIEDLSDNSIVIRGAPQIAKGFDVEEFFHDMADSLRLGRDIDVRKTIFEKMACHSAKRSGDALSEEDAAMLVREALGGGHELRCPHGRPYAYKIEKNDLEKIFKRK